ncbi:MAG: TDP-N-acetylfucosamine:lipid II N-acetylfucosaminyltransferase [Imperialibacter sp.]|uniref:TDP-N-acetylfucosamine:lipid II N-acetylfucosaminyltransferase n=1 Tax=Imperialibacter sp. TaxID=2038411 RepID=UPI0032EF32C5
MGIEDISIAHVCQDEKFIDGAFHSFDLAFPGQNKFYVLVPPGAQNIRYIRKASNLTKVVIDGAEVELLLKVCEQHTLVVLHGITHSIALLIEKFDKPEKFVWLILGAEMYQNQHIYAGRLLGELTTKLRRHSAGKVGLTEFLRDIYRRVKYRSLAISQISMEEQLEDIARSIGRIKCCASLLKEEFEYLESRQKLADDACYLPFTFYPIEYFIGKATEASVVPPSGENILIGNSASYTNNHLEVFEKLQSFDLRGRKLITPLSYGDPQYIKAISKIGYRQFPNNFHPLTEFLTIESYNEILSSCSIVIMNHYRQQGIGNILSTIYFGCKVYLSEESILYSFLRRIGCLVFSVESDLNAGNSETLKPLTLPDIEYNREILIAEISSDKIVSRLRKGVNDYLHS